MQAELPSRRRLIDRLRLFQVYRRHFGDEDATEAVDALQVEFAETATHADVADLKQWLREQLTLMDDRIDAKINAAMIKLVAAMGLIAGIALAIARLT